MVWFQAHGAVSSASASADRWAADDVSLSPASRARIRATLVSTTAAGSSNANARIARAV